MLRVTKAFVRKLRIVITTDQTLPFLILGVIGAAFAIAYVFEAGPAVIFASLLWAALPRRWRAQLEGIRTEHRLFGF
jgi:nucleoside recognition membrane protein YjiH